MIDFHFYLRFFEGIVYAITPEISNGNENTINKFLISTSRSAKYPKRKGPIIAPTRPIPKANPIPVDLMCEGYIRVAVGKYALKPPCTKKPSKKISPIIK